MEIKEFCKKINAVPMSVIEDIKAEIEKEKRIGFTPQDFSDGLDMAIKIIDKHISGEEQRKE